MRDILFTAAILFATAALIILLRAFTKNIGSACKRPHAELTVYFDENCECLEYTLGKLIRSSELRGLELSLSIVDTLNTEESRRWLTELRKKLGADFEILTEGERNGIKQQHGHDFRDR